jgi:hypothetical protein
MSANNNNDDSAPSQSQRANEPTAQQQTEMVTDVRATDSLVSKLNSAHKMAALLAQMVRRRALTQPLAASLTVGSPLSKAK